MAGVDKKTQVVKWLIEREEWDFFLVVFGETHPAGHYFWHLHDPTYIAHPTAGAGTLQYALRDIYVALDTALGDILQSVDDHTTVFLVSGDGMGPNYSGSHILHDLLGRMGLLKMHIGNGGESGDKPKSLGQLGRGKTDVLSTIRQLIPSSVRTVISRTLLPRRVKEKLSLRWLTTGIVWDQTRAFLISNANEGYVRINLKGREPQGLVEPGEEYVNLCEQIYRMAQSLTNPATGKPAVRAVYKADDIYHGPCRSHMPDIIINWDDTARVTTDLLVGKYGLAHSNAPGFALDPYYTGNHRPNAFMLAIGPDIPQGAVIEGAGILDLAPTILTYFGIEPPEYLDGKALSELCSHGQVRLAP